MFLYDMQCVASKLAAAERKPSPPLRDVGSKEAAVATIQRLAGLEVTGRLWLNKSELRSIAQQMDLDPEGIKPEALLELITNADEEGQEGKAQGGGRGKQTQGGPAKKKQKKAKGGEGSSADPNVATVCTALAPVHVVALPVGRPP